MTPHPDLRQPVQPARWHPAAPALTAILLVLAQICYPLTGGTTRDRVTIAVVVLSAATALTHAGTTRGPRYAAGFLLIVSGLGLLAEITGTASGFPFGCYHYAHGRLGPQLLDVPLLVPLAWTGGIYPIRAVATRLSDRPGPRIALVALGALGWDLFLDPQMVADGQWRWCARQPGLPGLPQIPYTDYLGWFAVALAMAILLELLDRGSPPGTGSAAVPIAVFLWTWLGSTLAHAVLLGLPNSARYGFAVLGFLGIPLLASTIRSRSRGPG